MEFATFANLNRHAALLLKNFSERLRTHSSTGEYAFSGAGAVVTDDAPAFALMLGNPARQSGWMSGHGERLSLPLKGENKVICPHTGEVYFLENNICRLERNHDSGSQP